MAATINVMKRILILIPSFEIGGTNSSLLSFLSEIDTKRLSVDIFSLRHSGAMKEKFPNCKILDGNLWLSMSIREGGVTKRFFNGLVQNMRRFFKRLGIDLYPIYGKIAGMQMNTQGYDAVCSFQEDLSHMLSCIPARKRIAWVRCEYSRYYNVYRIDESKYYKKIDDVVTVSEFTRQSFCKYYPDLASKTKVINNFLDEDFIVRQSKVPFKPHKNWLPDTLKIISVGRIDAVKQFEKIPDIVKEVLNNRPDAKLAWIIIGSGNKELESQIEDKVEEYKLQDYIQHLPAKDNVFPWVASADLFVHTSQSETYSRVVNEAKALNVPVLINNYGCADEFVENDTDGWIVPVDEMWCKIVELLDNRILLTKVRSNLENKHYDNEKILSQIIELI